MDNEFDPDWPHGHLMGDNPARIACTDAKGAYPIVALISDGHREWPVSFNLLGESPTGRVLRNAPAPKRRVQGWVNIYPLDVSVAPKRSKAEADAAARRNRIACIYIDVEEGEGM